MALHKKLACFVFLLALAGSIVAWSYGPFPTMRPVPVITPTPVLNQPLDTSNWKTYRNEELGFVIKIPPRWETDYKIEVKTWERGGYLKSVSFSHKIETEINPYTKERIVKDYRFFFISLVTRDWWEKKLNYEEPHPGIIQEVNDRVYIYDIGHDTETLERKEIRGLLSTFEVIE